MAYKRRELKNMIKYGHCIRSKNMLPLLKNKYVIAGLALLTILPITPIIACILYGWVY